MSAVEVYNPNDEGLDIVETREALVFYYNYTEEEVEKMTDDEACRKLADEEYYRKFDAECV